MKKPFVLFFLAAVVATAGLTGCGNSDASKVSTPAEHEALKGRQATPAEMQAAMARASQAHQQAPQQPK